MVDATIATMLCSGIATAQSMGIGGGFLMNIWFQDKKKSVTLSAKEVAPLAATKDMFKTAEEFNDGPLTIAVPGEVKGKCAKLFAIMRLYLFQIVLTTPNRICYCFILSTRTHCLLKVIGNCIKSTDQCLGNHLSSQPSKFVKMDLN